MKLKQKPYSGALKLNKLSRGADLLAFTLKVIGWLFSLGKTGDKNRVMAGLNIIASSFAKIAKDRGVVGLIESLKLTRSALFLYFSGEFPRKQIQGIKVSKEGIPVILKPFEQYIKDAKVADPNL